MAGIVGIFGERRRDDLARVVDRMTQRLPYEPWHITRCATGPDWALGQAWGAQWPGTCSPAASPSGRIHVALDGHLDNLDELDGDLPPITGDDAQAVRVARLLEQQGPALFGRLRGVFAIAAVDERERAAYLVSDRFGLRPLYYAQIGAKLLWASKVRALLVDPDVSTRADVAAVAQLLSCEYVLGDRTLLEAVRVLPPATVLTFRDGTARLSAYWRIRHAPRAIDAAEAAERFGDALAGAVQRVMALDRSTGIPLSGGIDSRSIAASVRPEHGPVQAFTFGFRWSHDVQSARRVARFLHAQHEVVESRPDYLPRWALAGVRATDGMVSLAHYQICQLLDAMSPRVQIVLDGLGGGRYRGAVVGGSALQAMAGGQEPDAVFEMLLSRYNTGVPVAQLRECLAPSGDTRATGALRAALAETWQASAEGSPDIWDRMDYVEFTQRVRRFAVYGSTHYLSRFEVAFPFMDYDVVDVLLTTPLSIRTSGALFTELYRRRWPALGRVTWAYTELPVLAGRWHRAAHWRIEHAKWRIKRLSGGRIAWRNRKSATDYPGWFRGPLASWLEGLLLDPQAASRRLVDRAYVERIWREHRTGAANRTAALGALATLELWCRDLYGHPNHDGQQHNDAVREHHRAGL